MIGGVPGLVVKPLVKCLCHAQCQGDGGETRSHAWAAWEHTAVGDVDVLKFMALSSCVYNGYGGIFAHAAGAAGKANNAERGFTAGMNGL